MKDFDSWRREEIIRARYQSGRMFAQKIFQIQTPAGVKMLKNAYKALTFELS